MVGGNKEDACLPQPSVSEVAVEAKKSFDCSVLCIGFDWIMCYDPVSPEAGTYRLSLRRGSTLSGNRGGFSNESGIPLCVRGG